MSLLKKNPRKKYTEEPFLSLEAPHTPLLNNVCFWEKGRDYRPVFVVVVVVVVVVDVVVVVVVVIVVVSMIIFFYLLFKEILREI